MLNNLDLCPASTATLFAVKQMKKAFTLRMAG